MIANVGTIDRLIRACVGLLLLWLAFLSGLPLFATSFWRYGAAIIGAVMLVVAVTRVCPIYALFGIRTCPR